MKTDSALQLDVIAALKREPSVNVSSGHEVTLGGPVQSRAERNLATHSAWGTPGVSNVVDNMTVADRAFESTIVKHLSMDPT